MYINEQLSGTMADLNIQIDKLMNPKNNDITPLLKLYD